MRRPWAALFGIIFVSTWCGNQFSPLLLLYQQRQHYSALTVNLFLGVYVLGLAPALLVAGALSDRHGRRPVMTAGVLCALAASTSLTFGSTGPAAIYLGRLLSGVTVGIAMSVGNSWLKELSQAPHDPDADTAAGARRASLAFALGSALGALVAGGIAQWGPWPEQLPFLVHIGVTLPFVWFVVRLPETSFGGVPGPLRAQLRIPALAHKRFRRVVMIASPWLFAAAALAYGYLPVLLAKATGRWGLAYATLLTVLTLGTAALVQPWAKRIHSPDSARGLFTALASITAGIALAGITAWRTSVPLGIVTGIVLGVGIGLGMVSGLLEVQRIATRTDLAGLTGVFYALAYAGFLTPTVMAAISSWVPTVPLFFALAVLAALCCAALLASSRKHLPAADVPTPVTPSPYR
ncbi:MAG TPA: MFS transporter [Amycolatopsis sp.]|jgi:MFS family permease|nr:MFS transporter [Amycolatopsis sp.]